MTNETQKEKLIVGIGLGLILIVGIITYIRSIPNKESSSEKAVQSQTKNYKKLSASELLKRINNKETVTIVDIRSDEAYVNKHILDSIHLTSSDFTNNELHLPKTGQIILVTEDEDETSVTQIANQLKKEGAEKIYELTGGIAMWESSGGQTISAGDPTIFTDQAKVKFISADDLKNSLEDNIYTIIDGRSKENFSQGHITGAINIPYEEIEKRREEIPTSKSIVTYDDNEVYGFQLGVRVNDLSLISPFVLREGFKAWKEKGFPVTQ